MTITSDVDICNLTASLLNVPPITSIETPENDTEEIFALWYDQVRKEALRRHSWNFAMKRAVLAATGTPPPFGFEKAFELPSDYIRISEVGSPPLQAADYVVEGHTIGITGVSNQSSALNIVYVSDFKTVTRMDASFIDYFATLLGQKVAYNFTQKTNAVERLDALMEKAEAKARAMDGQENPPKRIERSRMLNARRGGSRASRNSHVIYSGGS